jgi:hypothetical protein
MAFQKGGGPPNLAGGLADKSAAPVKSKPFGKKGGFQKKGFTPAMKSMRGGGRY